MSKRIKPKSIDLQDGQTLQSIIESAKGLGVDDLSKIVIDIDAFLERVPYSNYDYAECTVRLKKIK